MSENKKAIRGYEDILKWLKNQFEEASTDPKWDNCPKMSIRIMQLFEIPEICSKVHNNPWKKTKKAYQSSFEDARKLNHYFELW